MPQNRCCCVYWLFHFQCFTISNVRIARKNLWTSWSFDGRQVPATRWYQVMSRQHVLFINAIWIWFSLCVSFCNSFLWSHPKEIETQRFSNFLRVAERFFAFWLCSLFRRQIRSRFRWHMTLPGLLQANPSALRDHITKRSKWANQQRKSESTTGYVHIGPMTKVIRPIDMYVCTYVCMYQYVSIYTIFIPPPHVLHLA